MQEGQSISSKTWIADKGKNCRKLRFLVWKSFDIFSCFLLSVKLDFWFSHEMSSKLAFKGRKSHLGSYCFPIWTNEFFIMHAKVNHNSKMKMRKNGQSHCSWAKILLSFLKSYRILGKHIIFHCKSFKFTKLSQIFLSRKLKFPYRLVFTVSANPKELLSLQDILWQKLEA